jgi:Zn-dependent peptidase ImmA (M78 family)
MQSVPYRKNEEIWVEVERFRLQESVSSYLAIPIDSVAIAEIVFRLKPVPFPNLFSKYKQDAAITPDLKDILIDEEAYMRYESGDSWVEKRLRFSVAHELGHVFMHSNEIKSSRFNSFEDFRRWMGSSNNPKTSEYQADEFAGRLLVPRESLLDWYDKYVDIAQGNDPEWWQHSGARKKLASKIAPRFGVNYQVIETRFDREGLWPANEILRGLRGHTYDLTIRFRWEALKTLKKLKS